MHLPIGRTLRRAAGASALAVAALLVPVTPAVAAPSPATIVGTVTGPDGEVLAGIGVGITASTPRGLAFQCREVPFSPTAQLKTSFTMTVGGAIQGTIGDGSFRGTMWVDWNGRRINGDTDSPSGNTYTIGNIPTGTYVVHAQSYDGGPAAQSAPVSVVQGKVTKNVTVAVQ